MSSDAAGPLAGIAHPDADDVLAALDPQQREVASSPLGPMCVLAGAGTGKTRAITHRIAYGVLSGVYRPQQVLAVTFTARAAGEMRTRLRDLGVAGAQARTFHAAALRQLHYFWPATIGGAAPEVLPAKASVVAAAAARLRMSFDRTAIRDLASEIEWAKVSMLTAQSYPEAAARHRREPPGVDATGMARLMTSYEEVKTERGVIDFEDVLLITVAILEENGEVADAVRSQYRYFVVDEYQDVNALQQRLLRCWLGERNDICVVGDPSQTIYSFTGASPSHLVNFAKNQPGASVVELTRNYRSTPQIVRLANAVLGGVTGRAGAVPSSTRSPGGEPTTQGASSASTAESTAAPTGPVASGRDLSAPLHLVAQRPDGPEPTMKNYPDDPAEAAGVASEIEQLITEGANPADIAVLFRTNAQSEGFEAALSERNIPYLVRGGERFFQRKEVRDAIVLLRGQARSDTGELPLPEITRDVLVGAGWTRQAPTTAGATRERWESLAALAGLADELAAINPEARLPDLIRELDERAAAQHAPQVQGVTLASLHAAKGLEWSNVFLAGCSDGFLPIAMAEGAAAIAEERRLLYVGLTRAQQRLTISWSSARTPGARASRRPSRFFDAAANILGTAATRRPAQRSGPAPKRVRRAQVCRGCGNPLSTAAERTIGRCTSCPATYDEALFERLRSWRLAVARAASVPAFVVFTDATLTAIAEQEPADREALLAIPGVGERKLTAYGDALLAVLAGEDPDVAAQAVVRGDEG